MSTLRTRDGTGFFFGNWETGRPVDFAPDWLGRAGSFAERGLASAMFGDDARTAEFPPRPGAGADASATVHG